ncbi:hypothetical protein COY17_03605 [Candidatus Saccharibacteria bacterium CG_4_10_14_0_2_um_filter_52_9]|nr:MAG: hypothetical protein COY17_03605 [Candidatus Saccharibacteria bacterium CG_4_10_14_0_2_um_filter_52_9]
MRFFTPEFHNGLITRLTDTFSLDPAQDGLKDVYPAADDRIQVGLSEAYVMADGKALPVSKHEFAVMASLAVRTGSIGTWDLSLVIPGTGQYKPQIKLATD